MVPGGPTCFHSKIEAARGSESPKSPSEATVQKPIGRLWEIYSMGGRGLLNSDAPIRRELGICENSTKSQRFHFTRPGSPNCSI